MSTNQLTATPGPTEPAVTFSRTSRAAFLLSYGLLAGASLWGCPEIRSLAVPLAGPFAARLWGHTCGISDLAPQIAYPWLALGLVALPLALRVRRGPWLAPFWVFWAGWLLLGGISMINLLE